MNIKIQIICSKNKEIYNEYEYGVAHLDLHDLKILLENTFKGKNIIKYPLDNDYLNGTEFYIEDMNYDGGLDLKIIATQLNVIEEAEFGFILDNFKTHCFIEDIKHEEN